MNRAVLIEGIVFFVIGAFSLFEGLRLTIKRDPVIVYDKLGPGVLILFLGIILLVTSVCYIIKNCRNNPTVENKNWGAGSRLKIIGSVGMLSAYSMFIDLVGYLFASLIFFFVEFRILGVRSWLANIILALVVTFVFYIVFLRYLNIIFPRGLL